MNIDIKDIITLSDDNKYLVVSKAKKNDKTYYLLANVENIKNIKIVFESKEKSVIELEDERLIQELKLYFTKSTLEDLKDII